MWEPCSDLELNLKVENGFVQLTGDSDLYSIIEFHKQCFTKETEIAITANLIFAMKNFRNTV